MSSQAQPMVLTPNQIVAFRLRTARGLRGMTQEQAADALEPLIGARWSKASFSAAERSYDSERVRRFSADEIFAFARVFRLPITYFFLPPAFNDRPTVIRPHEEAVDGLVVGPVLDVIFSEDEGVEVVRGALAEILEHLPPDELSRWQQITNTVGVVTRQALIAEQELGLRDMAEQLRSIADVMENAEQVVGTRINENLSALARMISEETS